MFDKRTEKKNALKARLLKGARAIIAAKGLDALRARELATDAGCAIGSVYNAFDDMDDLILQVNAETLNQLGKALFAAMESGDHAAALRSLALTYARFARENRNLWSALFDHRMTDGGPSPDWFLNAHTALLEYLVTPLRQLRSDLPEEILKLRARTYFAAVHGIVSISLQGRFLGLPKEALEDELEAFVADLTNGLLHGVR